MFEFTKMHALGNDFVIIDAIRNETSFHHSQAKSVADRHYGIGCDQILLVNSKDENSDVFQMQIFNADGSSSAQCGNGARCVAQLVYDRQYTSQREFVLQTRTQDLRCTVKDSQVSVTLGVPNFNPADIPFITKSAQNSYCVTVDGESLDVSALSIGNPHAVLFVSDTTQATVSYIGPLIETHSLFPERTNVEFTELVSRTKINLRVYERGVGETLACGSGACAAVIAGIRRGFLDSSVEVKMAAGSLWVDWQGEGKEVHLTGPATYVYEGSWLS